MIVEPNRGWIEDNQHLGDLSYADATLVTDLVKVQHTVISDYLKS